MRVLVLASLLGGALPLQAQTVPTGDYQLASVKDGEGHIILTSHTVAKGETVEGILKARGIQPSPRAIGLVLEANPDVRGVNRIPAGTVLRTPQIEGAATGAGPAKIISPLIVRDAALTADALERNAGRLSQAGCTEECGPPAPSGEEIRTVQQYSHVLRESLEPTYGLSANAMSQWNAHSRAILDLTMSNKAQDQHVAVLLARESSDELPQVRTMAMSGKPTALLVTLKGLNPPSATYPSTCRIRYAFLGYAYSGHVVPSSHVQDPVGSDCEEGRAQLEAWIPYGIWTEWVEGNTWRRSEIKRVKLLPQQAITIDLPMQPYE